MTERPRILVVDSESASLATLREILARDYVLFEATDGPAALAMAERVRPDLVLLEITTSGLDGYDVCRRLRSSAELAQTKVILVSERAMTSERVAGYRAGADDTISKPFDGEELRAKIQVFMRMKRIEEASDLNRVLVAELETANSQLSAEVRRRKFAEEQLRHESLHDVLTNLPNRALLLDRIQRCQLRQRREPNFGFAVFFLDLDDFKVVNDSLGHDAGDELLIEVSRRITNALRDQDSVSRVECTADDGGTTARLGGDEFVILVEGIHSPEEAWIIERRIRSTLSLPVTISGTEVRPNGSIGIAFGAPEYDTPGDVLRDADTAMYHAKSLGKSQTAIFDATMRARAVHRQRMEIDLQRAIAREEFYLHYQPIVALSTGRLSGFEALVRWAHPERGTLSPAEFIPLAEETGLIVPIGDWVLREACRQTALWHTQFPDRAQLGISINVSGRQLLAAPVHETLRAVLKESGLDPRCVSLELTETVMIDTSGGSGVLLRLTGQGVALSMDDFGTGFSSLSYLSRLPISAVKLDGSFISEMLVSRAGGVTVRAVLEMCHARGLRVVAEGVERREQVAALGDYNCDLAQGFYFSEPLSAVEATVLLQDPRDWTTAEWVRRGRRPAA